MIASICDSPVVIRNFLRADDTNHSLSAVAACGVMVENIQEGDPVVHGAGLRGLTAPARPIEVGNSGTTIRLFPGILAGQQGSFVLDGDASIRRRPMDRITAPLRQMGVKIEAQEGGFAPISLTGGPVKAISYAMPVASAQVKSCVLLAGLYGDGPTSVIEPAVCRNHTEIMLAAAGARVEKNGLETTVCPPDRLHLDEVVVPNDFSSAAFFIVAATIIPGSRVDMPAVGINPTRTGLLDILDDMGANIVRKPAPGYTSKEPSNDLHVTAATLRGVTVGADISGRSIDELPLVALLGAFAEGETIVRGAAELRHKESDRISLLVQNLSAVGVDIEELPDGFVIRGGGGIAGGSFKSMGDHRMAMMGAVAGAASGRGVDVIGFGCVSVSFPAFEESFRALL
jgi:3-phosphoshikimate 1-carboxyvinyltransferase